MNHLGVGNLVGQAGHNASVSSTQAPAAPPRLVQAAHEFEASMMRELLAPLEHGHDLVGEEEDGTGSSDALGSFAGEALGKAISEHGGLGIAKSILHKLTSESNHSGNSPVPAGQRRTTTQSSFQ